ncbi:18392_t:CDS:2, partial [Gigaspora margarita]
PPQIYSYIDLFTWICKRKAAEKNAKNVNKKENQLEKTSKHSKAQIKQVNAEEVNVEKNDKQNKKCKQQQLEAEKNPVKTNQRHDEINKNHKDVDYKIKEKVEIYDNSHAEHTADAKKVNVEEKNSEADENQDKNIEKTENAQEKQKNIKN